MFRVLEIGMLFIGHSINFGTSVQSHVSGDDFFDDLFEVAGINSLFMFIVLKCVNQQQRLDNQTYHQKAASLQNADSNPRFGCGRLEPDDGRRFFQ